MAYAALQDMIDRYGSAELVQLTDTTGAGVRDPDVVGQALGDAASMMDAYLASRYVLPLSPVPPIILRWCCDITRFLLWRTDPSDAVKALYGAAIAGLKAVQSGAMVLEANAIDAETNTDIILLEGAPRRFDSARPDRGFGGF